MIKLTLDAMQPNGDRFYPIFPDFVAKIALKRTKMINDDIFHF